MSCTRLLFETFVDTRSPELNANGCNMVSEMFRSRRLPSPGRPEEALREAWCSGPASRPPCPVPTPQLCSQRQQGVSVGRAHVCGPGLTVTHKAEALTETQGPPPPGGGDGVCCCRTWNDRAGPWEAASDNGVRSGRRFFPPNQAGDSGAGGEGTGVAAEGAGPLPGVTGRSGGSCPGVQAELGLIPSGGVWMLSLRGAS